MSHKMWDNFATIRDAIICAFDLLPRGAISTASSKFTPPRKFYRSYSNAREYCWTFFSDCIWWRNMCWQQACQATRVHIRRPALVRDITCRAECHVHSIRTVTLSTTQEVCTWDRQLLGRAILACEVQRFFERWWSCTVMHEELNAPPSRHFKLNHRLRINILIKSALSIRDLIYTLRNSIQFRKFMIWYWWMMSTMKLDKVKSHSKLLKKKLVARNLMSNSQ